MKTLRKAKRIVLVGYEQYKAEKALKLAKVITAKKLPIKETNPAVNLTSAGSFKPEQLNYK